MACRQASLQKRRGRPMPLPKPRSSNTAMQPGLAHRIQGRSSMLAVRGLRGIGCRTTFRNKTTAVKAGFGGGGLALLALVHTVGTGSEL